MKVGKTELFSCLNSFLQAQCVCSVTLFPRQVVTRQRHLLRAFSSGSIPRSIPCFWASFNNLPRSHTLIIPVTPSGSPRKHSLVRQTHVKVIGVALLTGAVVTNMHMHLYRQLSMTSWSGQSWSHSCLNIHSLYIQFHSLIHLSTDWSNKVIS